MARIRARIALVTPDARVHDDRRLRVVLGDEIRLCEDGAVAITVGGRLR
jgi:hypothetical protein